MVYVVPGYKQGLARTEENLRLFLYPADDIEACCMELEAAMKTPHERRRCVKYNLETEEIKEGNACVLRIMGFINGKRISDYAIWKTVERVMSRRDQLPVKQPRFEFRYEGIPEDALFEITI